MAFMCPVYYVDTPHEVETTIGTEIVPSFVCNSRYIQDYADYVEGTILAVHKLKKGIVWRLSASGYLDATTWNYAENYKQARKDCEELYSCNPDNGDNLED